MNEDDVKALDKTLPEDVIQERDSVNEALRKVGGIIILHRLSYILKEPTCPQCDVGVLSPKCPWGHIGTCPRHRIVSHLGGHKQLKEHLESLEHKPKPELN